MVTLFYFLALVVATCNAAHSEQTASVSSSQSGTERAGCIADVIEGKGDFKLQKKIYPVKNPGFYIESIKLLKRTSFYRCEPKALKYGVSDNSYSWWVNKGCEGMFEIVECPDANPGRHTGPEAAKIDIAIIQTFDTPAPTYDIRELQIQGIENRFLYAVPIVNV